ncbi:ArnT family glycosyltransferase [Deferribacter abyssi]|uniref:ArnT family glycosyltransferase n=1 Tax=Deferribacter abyssi TaxID=213806 RepID=UPI003C16B8DA
MLLYFLILIYPIKFIPLFETTEARYSEIAREMVVSGDYIEPRFNGIKHFHKPPFTYWMIAAGLKIFGINGFGARFFGVLAAVVSIFFLFKISKIFFKQDDDCFNIALIYASSFLFLVISRISSTDIYLTMWTVIAQYFLFRQIYYKKQLINVIFYALALGFGFLTKGPIIFLFTILPFYIGKVFDKNHRKVFKISEVIIAFILFISISLPWYIVVIIKNPDLLNYFLKVQTIDRVATNRFHRYKPFYFFILVFIGGFLPYSFYFLKGMFNLNKMNTIYKVFFTYIIVPFVIFSIAKSKLATYILPLFPISSIFAYIGIKEYDNKIIRYISLVFLILIVFVLMFSGFFYKPLFPYKKTIVLYGILVMLTLAPVIINLNNEKFVKSVSFSIISLSFIIYMILPTIGPSIKGYRLMTFKINELDPEKKLNVLVYKDFIPSISFYRNKLAVIAYGKEREVQFENDDNYKQFYLTDDREINEFIRNNKSFFLVSRPKRIGIFQKKFNVICRKIYEQRKQSAYLCKQSE